VIQAQGGPVTADRFTLYGVVSETGLGPSSMANYSAQILAGRGIAVATFHVQLGTRARSGEPGTGPADSDTEQRAFEEIAQRLVSERVGDPKRLGINGFSRTGFYAIHTLSHSNLRFAAAVVSDNVDYSYIQVVLGDTYRDAEAVIGAPAYGSGLKTWLDHATGFNVDAIHAPVLLIGQSAGARVIILEQWEILSLLRHLKRPVEMYVMPEIEAHPSHYPQNPRQVMAVQERAVDWFDFWLNGHEMPGKEKAAQYERWRRLRSEQAEGSMAVGASSPSAEAQ
jgi:dipeptidyl aminopeptidase/acylaminoacyl peptidase